MFRYLKIKNLKIFKKITQINYVILNKLFV